MRASSVTLPCSSSGTLKSTRMKTRLPPRSRLSMVLSAMVQRLWLAAMRYLARSTMRFEKPHSLSYQAKTFAKVSSMTWVFVASKIDERGLPL